MPWQPADKNASCVECQQLARELNERYAEAYLRNQPAADALAALVGGTEEDAERAETQLRSYRYQMNPGRPPISNWLAGVTSRLAQHMMRTGHILETGRKRDAT